MQLQISNVGKIENTLIDIDGITVIAGENNAGKSTIGKLLFAIFNCMNNMTEKIEQEKKNRINRIISVVLQNRYIQRTNNYAENRRRSVIFARKLTDDIIVHLNSDSEENIQDFLYDDIKGSPIFESKEDVDEFVNDCADKLEAIINVSDEKAMAEVITRWFSKVFGKQMSPLKEDGIESKIELTIKGKKLSFLFKDNVCINWKSEFNIMHGAFYIDNPFIVDEMSNQYRNTKITETQLLKFLCEEKEDIFDGIFDAVMAKDRLNEIFGILNEVIGGDIVENQEGEYCFNYSDYNKPLYIENLSTGLKSFALIKKLLENGSIKDKDVLVLDEPEIHLHPEWQLLYAKLIVLLQKEFDLSMIITTHSPYFLDAIDVYSSIYGTSENAHYYLAENEGEVSTIREVTNNIDAIYKKLSDPMQKLENLRNSIN